MINALNNLNKKKINKKKLALQSMHLEQEILKENVGSQDQIAAVYGGFNCIHFLQKSLNVLLSKLAIKIKKFEN